MTTTNTDFQYDVFISYARKDGAEKAETLANALRGKGFSVYYDLYQNEPGIDWWQRIKSAINQSKALVFIITENSVTSSVCRDEWETAETLNRPILPVKVVDSHGHIIADSDIPPHISRIHYIDTVKNWDAGIDEITHFLTRYDYLYELSDDLAQLVSESTARRFIEIIATENAAAKKQLKRRVRARTLHHQPTQNIEFNSFDDAWEHYNGQILLLGAPGAGKTTTLLHYAQTLVTRYLGDRNQPVPIYESIAYWDSYANQPLHEWLPDHNNLPDDMREVIRHGRAVLILDGLDELGNSKPINPEKPEEGIYDPRKRFLEQVQTAIDAGNQILITCRVEDYEDIGEKLAIKGAIELQQLTDEQIKTYLGDVPTVQETVMGDSDLLEICRSPLLLSLIAFGYRYATDDLKALPSMQEGDLRDAIFERYITASYDFEASRRELLGEEMPFTLEKVMDVLGHVAMINVARGRRDNAERNKVIENVLIYHDFTHQLDKTEIDDFLQFVNHMNIIEADEDEHYHFMHLLIRDFLAYQKTIGVVFNESEYENNDLLFGPFGDLLELLINGTPVIQVLVNLADSRVIPMLCEGYQYFSGESLIQSKIIAGLSIFKDSSVEALLIQASQTHDSSLVRMASIEALGKIGNDKTISILHQLLNDIETAPKRVERVCDSAANAIGNIGGQLAVTILIDILQNRPDAEIRRVSVEALGKIGDLQAVPTLIDKLINDFDSYVRRYCAEGLGNIGDVKAVPALIDKLQNDSDSYVRRYCAEGLGNIGDVKAVPALIHSLQNDFDSNVRRKSAEALGKLGDVQAVPVLIDRLQNDSNSGVRKESAWVLGNIGDAQTVPALIGVLNSIKNLDIVVIQILEKIGTPEALQAVKEWREAQAKDDNVDEE